MTPRVVVLAQDLIWSDRLARLVEAAGAVAERVATGPAFDRALDGAGFAIVDLTARAYDPLAAIERAHERSVHVLAVGPHDDVDERKEALARGADQVLAYRKLADDGPATVERWLARAEARPASTASTPAQGAP